MCGGATDGRNGGSAPSSPSRPRAERIAAQDGNCQTNEQRASSRGTREFHIMQHANEAIDEVRRAEFFRKGGRMRGVVKGKRWLLLSRWVNLTAGKRQELNQLFALNRRACKAYILKETLDRLWTYHYEGAMLNYLQRWIDQLRWQRLEPFQKLTKMLLEHLDGILNYCRTKVALGVVEAVNGNIKSLLRRGRGYQNLRYLLLKAQRIAATKTEFVVFRKAA